MEHPFVVRNLRDQPVELHLLGGVRVLPPRGHTPITEADRTAPQLLVLEKHRAVVVREADPKVDVNVATLAQLDALPGVAPATAQALLDHRAAHGRFERVEDLLAVPGIKKATLARLRDLITLRS